MELMSNKVVNKCLAILVFSLILFWGKYCFALTFNLISPPNGAKNVCIAGAPDGCKVSPYFEWEESKESAVEYGVNFHKPGEAWVENRIRAGDPKFYTAGEYRLGFLDLKVGTITYTTGYIWKVIAYDASGVAVDSSLEWTFETEQPPAPPCPYECLSVAECEGKGGSCVDGSYEPCPPSTPCCCSTGGEDGGGGGGFIIKLMNPLKAKTLWEAIDALINFLVVLAFAIAPILIIYATFLILTAGGRAEQINKAKTLIFWTLIALAIVLLAKALPSIIKGALGG